MGEVSLIDVSKRFHLRLDGKVHEVSALNRVSFTVCDGEIAENGTVIRCPWHNWSFELETGEHCLDPRERLRTYEVRTDGDQVILCA